LHDGSYLKQRAKLFAYVHVNNNIQDIKRILQDKQFHPQLKSEQKEIIQNVLERKDSMAVLPTGFGNNMCYVPPSHFGQGKIIYANHLP
jgi:ATP-dependent DNA helicase RecQ